MSEAEQPWLTTRQFAEYWRTHAPDGCHVWAVTDESGESAPGEGYSLVGLYASPLDALAVLAKDELGPESTARLTWRPSSAHDGYWEVYGRNEARGTGRHYILADATIQANVADGRGFAALARAIALSPNSDPYSDDGAA